MTAHSVDIRLREDAEEAEILFRLVDEFVTIGHGTDRDLAVARRARDKLRRRTS